MTDKERDQLLFKIHAAMVAEEAHRERLQRHIETINARLLEIDRKVTITTTRFEEHTENVRTRLDEHTGRISLVEDGGRHTGHFQSKILGALLVVPFLLSLAAILLSWLKNK